MKKAYAITPERYRSNIKVMEDARYHHGESLVNAPESVKKKCIKAAKENATIGELPKERIFFENEVMYNLFLNRDTDEPITARELYAIVQTLSEAIEEAEDRARTAAAYTDYDFV